MDEVFPVLGGIALGLATFAVRPMWLRVVVVGTLGVGIGAVASWISGELAISAAYLVIDIVQVLGAAIATAVLVGVWRRRRSARTV